MKLKGSLIGFALITCLYLGLLIWLDARKQVFTHLPQLWQPLLSAQPPHPIETTLSLSIFLSVLLDRIKYSISDAYLKL